MLGRKRFIGSGTLSFAFRFFSDASETTRMGNASTNATGTSCSAPTCAAGMRSAGRRRAKSAPARTSRAGFPSTALSQAAAPFPMSPAITVSRQIVTVRSPAEGGSGGRQNGRAFGARKTRAPSSKAASIRAMRASLRCVRKLRAESTMRKRRSSTRPKASSAASWTVMPRHDLTGCR